LVQVNHLRILELRDRLRAEPAPFLYAQLAEEYRRAREADEAVACCRECLARYPAYLSVRVILGRALAERGALDAAAREFEQVLGRAPDNLTATRDLAEIELRRGRLERALDLYRKALVLFRHDSELEERIRTVTRQIGAGDATSGPLTVTASAVQVLTPEPAVVPTPSAAAVDFDQLLASLGAGDQPLPPLMEMLLEPAEGRGPTSAPARTRGFSRAPAAAARLIADLERWLQVIERRRAPRAGVHGHANRPA
jgi:tetratricopeptide (TPR) repeat protein